MGPGEASAIVAGEGPLAGAAAIAVATAGFGRIGLAGAASAEHAAAKLGLLVPETVVEPYPVGLEPANAGAIVALADVVLACGSPEEQQLVNDACCEERVPLVVGELHGHAGLVLSVRPGATACRRCASPVEPQTAGGAGDGLGEGGLEALAGIVGSLQALEAVKLVTGTGAPLLDRLLTIHGSDMSQTIVPIAAQDGCPACARVPAACARLPGAPHS